MCGIVGVLDPARRRPAPETTELLRRMATAMEPRGPDGDGYWTDEASGVGFGHRRLAIVDLSEHGVQPMTSADGRWIITYNGEIYNHRELHDELAALGIRFRGHSDTEYLVEAIARWGLVDTLDRVDGMFAFAVWDRDRRELTLARDRLGEKPLYYGTIGGNELVFGSSLDAIRQHPRFDRPVDRDSLAMYFRYKYVPAPWSIYEGIRKLGPGCTVTVDAAGRCAEEQAYWSLYSVAAEGPAFAGTDAEAIDELDRLLRRSVERRMIADVPVGAFLSGGIDSATVVGAAQATSSTPVRTFTIGSTHADFDESADARAIATHLGTDHTELTVTDADALAVVGRLATTYDEPFADSSQIPTRLVSELARREVTVALSGDGGDELFGGYNRYLWVPPIWSKLRRLPNAARRGVGVGGRSLPPSVWDRLAAAIPDRRRPQQLGLKVSKVLDVVDASGPEEVFHRLCSHWMAPDELVRGGHERPDRHTDPRQWPRSGSIVEHMMLVDALTYLPDDVLAKVDRAAMSVSLETRVPYLDRDIVELAVRLPVSMRIRDGQSKWPLRQVLDRYVPRALMDRPKSGFGLPIDDWLRGALKPWAEELIADPLAAAFLDRDLIDRRWKDHQASRRNNAYLLWDVLMFVDWARHRGIDPLGITNDRGRARGTS